MTKESKKISGINWTGMALAWQNETNIFMKKSGLNGFTPIFNAFAQFGAEFYTSQIEGEEVCIKQLQHRMSQLIQKTNET